MSAVLQPSVAGQFYDDSAADLSERVRGFLSDAEHFDGPRPKALISPHAGYIYSGPIAGSAFAALVPYAAQIHRVVLLGPSHRVPFEGLVGTSAEAMLTPLGRIAIDREAMDQALALPQVTLMDRAFVGEHCLEVQLPFLQMVLDDFALVPLLVGDAGEQETAAVLETLWGGEETLILISSDLSHFLDYDTAKRTDEATSEAIVNLAPERLGYNDACGRNPIRGLLHEAKRRGLHARMLDLRSSGDTSSRRDRVVGYGAYVFG